MSAVIKLLRNHFWGALETTPHPVLKINDHATGGRRTKDILGGPKGWGPKKKVANVEIYVIFEVFAFCGGRTKTDFKDQDGGPRHRAAGQVLLRRRRESLPALEGTSGRAPIIGRLEGALSVDADGAPGHHPAAV